MPKIPLIQETVGIPQFRQPRATPADFGAGVAQGLENLGSTLTEISDAQRKQQDAIDFAKVSGENDAALGNLSESVKTEPDFQKREKLFQDEALKTNENFLKQAPNSSVRNALTIHQSQTLPKKILEFRKENQKDWNSSKRADVLALEEIMSDRVISSNDPEEANRTKNVFRGIVDGLSLGPYPAMNREEAAKRYEQFINKITVKRAQRMISESPDQFFVAADAGEFKDLTEDQVYKLRETARNKIKTDEESQHRAFTQVQDIVERGWQATANDGKINQSELDDALHGRNPYISPEKARALKAINDNPPTGEGSQQIQALMSEYYLGERTVPRINNTRAKLRALQQQLGRPNPLISKAANELQSDQTAAENTGIARDNVQVQRDNRNVRDLKTSYDAWVEANPFMKKLLGNVAERDKARLADTYNKEGAESASKMLEGLIKSNQTKADAVKNTHDKALNW